MQKNNLCPLPNKVLIYEETDVISQSIFNPKQLFSQIKSLINNNRQNYKDTFIKNPDIFCIYRLYNKINSISKKNDLLTKYYSYKESITLFPKREFYFRHHLEFLEKPNLINTYFNKKEKKYGLDKLNNYQFQKKKEKINITKDSLKSDKKIFNANVLEEIENYSTTITQSSNNEKNTIPPLEIFRRCEDNKKLLQKEKEKEKINDNKDKKSKITFSESRISNSSKNILDESLIKMIKEFPGKFHNINKKEKPDKKISTYFNNKKGINNKYNKSNKNNNQNILNMNKFIRKENSKNKRLSTSKNKKNKIISDIINHNSLINNNSKRKSFVKNIKNINTNKSNTLYYSKKKNKPIINLKESNIIKKNRNILGNNNTLKNNNKIKNKIVESISFNTIEDFINFFMTPKSNKIYGDINIKRQNKKNSALTFVNNINNISHNNSEEKYKKTIKKRDNKLYKSKSPIRLFLKRK